MAMHGFAGLHPGARWSSSPNYIRSRRNTQIAGALLALILCPAPALARQAERVAAPVRTVGVVFEDINGNGQRDAGERGIAGIGISDQVTIVETDANGHFEIDAAGYGVVFIVQPDGYRVRGLSWRRADATEALEFALERAVSPRTFTFLHASDVHLSEQSLPRMQRLRALVDSLNPSFVLVSGDLVRDALRVGEAEARGYYELLQRELALLSVPVHVVPGNHEIFGIERHHSLVSTSHPLYGKRMYRSFLGPNYYSFDFGGMHFIGFDTVDYDDLWYHGHVDSVQLAWLQRDLARLPPDRRVVSFNHIPLVTANETIGGVVEDGVAPTVIRIGGRAYFRHVVNNTSAVLDVLGERLEIALGGHIHRREQVRLETARGTRRFFQTAAVTGPPTGGGPLGLRSGVTLYHVTDGRVDDGTFIPLDPDPRL